MTSGPTLQSFRVVPRSLRVVLALTLCIVAATLCVHMSAIRQIYTPLSQRWPRPSQTQTQSQGPDKSVLVVESSLNSSSKKTDNIWSVIQSSSPPTPPLLSLPHFTASGLDIPPFSGLIVDPKPNLRSISPVDVRLDQPLDLVTGRANATFVVLARNKDIAELESSMKSVESQFNHAHNYPWILFNDEPFSEDFKQRVKNATRGEVQFELVPREWWVQPDWIDEAKAEDARNKMAKPKKGQWPVPYAKSVSYRNMCRYNSGFFFRNAALKPYKWYWRVEPGVDFSCKILFDPFEYMIKNNKRYAFNVAIKEYATTITSLWDTVKDFRAGYPDMIAEGNGLDFISNDKGKTYNLCHFWSNFEIGDLDFFRSDEYLQFFEHLDDAGGFYYERWGDAPVHSIAAALFLPKSQIHFFDEIGYYHTPIHHCPKNMTEEMQCTCDPGKSIDYTSFSCLKRFEAMFAAGTTD